MSTSTKNTIKRILDKSKNEYRKAIDTIVYKNSPDIYGQPLSVHKNGKIVNGKSPNFKLIHKIEHIRKSL